MAIDQQPTSGRTADNIVGFARALRAAGIPVGPGAVIDAMNAIALIEIGNRADVFATLEAIFVKRHEHALVFAQAFDIEPNGEDGHVREVSLYDCHLGLWWDPSNSLVNSPLSITGGQTHFNMSSAVRSVTSRCANRSNSSRSSCPAGSASTYPRLRVRSRSSPSVLRRRET